MIKDKNIVVYNVITSNKLGGAELLVNNLSVSLNNYGIESYTIYGNLFHQINPSKNQISLNLRNLRSIRFIFRLRKILKTQKNEKKVQILHLHLTWPLIYGLIASYGLNYKIIYTEHNTFNKRRNIPLGRVFDYFLYRNCRKIICISNNTKNALLKWQLSLIDRKKIEVIHNGARKYKFRSRNYYKNKGLNLISIGSLTFQKGFDLSINSIAHISDQVESYIILGEGEMRLKLENLIQKQDLSSKVKLVGLQENIQPYLDQANLAIVPSRWEGFSLATIEMISAGLPLLINENYGGPKEVLQCKSVFAKDLSTSIKIANSIRKIKATLIKNNVNFTEARSLAKKFSLDNFSKNYADIYKSIN